MRIDSCFDSHVHWAAAGEFSQRLDLKGLKSPKDVLNLKALPHHFRGAWLLGYGWDDSSWSDAPTRATLDAWIPDQPVVLTRVDAHCMWLNTMALRLVGILERDPLEKLVGGRIVRDAQGLATGLLVDRACDLVHEKIPPVTDFEMRRQLLIGMHVFNDAGWTHIRDMTCTEVQWNQVVHLEEAGLLTLAIEEYFHLRDPKDLRGLVELAVRARASQGENVRVKGLKLFLDGALGSEGAWLSKCYCHRDHKGLVLWTEESLVEAMRLTWEAGLELAVHAIGDAAVDHLVEIAQTLRASGYSGALHIEHGELIRNETILKMKSLPISVHMQPSHWLSDHSWLTQKIGDLAAHAFPWRRLQESEVDLHFGSDAPIEPPSLTRALRALEESSHAGVPRLLGTPESYFRHPDPSWAAPSFTEWTPNWEPRRVVFRGTEIRAT